MVGVTPSHRDKWWTRYCSNPRRLCEPSKTYAVEGVELSAYMSTQGVRAMLEGRHLLLLHYHFNLLPGHP